MRFLFGAFTLLIFSVSFLNVSAANSNILISEVQINGGTGHSNDDFIELYNPTEKEIDIVGWKLKKRIKSGTEASVKDFSFSDEKHVIIPSGGYLLWTNSSGAFTALTDPQFITGATLTSDNSIALFDGEERLVDALTYGSGHNHPYSPSLSSPANPGPKISLERNLENNSFFLQSNPTPQNDAGVTEDPPEPDPEEDVEEATSRHINVRLNEVFPNPKEKGETTEFVEFFNFGEENADLSGFILRDGSKTGKYILPKGSLIAPEGYLILSRETSKLSFNNSSDTVSLFNTANELIDTVSYEKSKEGLSFSFDGGTFRWSKHLTPGEINILDKKPLVRTDIPKVAYKDIATPFSSGGPSSFRYLWDFGDGAKSRKQETEHVYEKTGTYRGSLTIDNGAEEVITNFALTVKKYSAQDIFITAFVPNPEGNDSENETLTLKNTGKKKVDLKGWSIATGSKKKKLVNHPIRESFVIKSGKERVLDRDFSMFSLPNNEGFIELRQPNKKVIQKIQYKEGGEKEVRATYVLGADKTWSWTGNNSQSQEEGIVLGVATVSPEEESVEDTPRHITLEDLSPEERAFLEKQVEEKVRARILAELAAQSSENQGGEIQEAENQEERANAELQAVHTSGWVQPVFLNINEKLNELFLQFSKK